MKLKFVARVMPTCWVVRTSGDPMSHASLVQREILAVDPEQPVSMDAAYTSSLRHSLGS